MERFPYWVKRQHWKVTWTAIHLFEGYAVDWGIPVLKMMTPARLDILHLIEQRLAWTKRPAGHAPSMALGAIVGKLGLHPSTISKCVARMEELGLVTRSRSDDDLRRTIVTLTSLGLQGIGAAFRVLHRLQDELRRLSAAHGPRPTTRWGRVTEAPRSRWHPTPGRMDPLPPEPGRATGGRWAAHGDAASLAEIVRRCAQLFGSRAVDLWAPDYVDAG